MKITERLRIYINYGIGGFLFTLVLLLAFQEVVMFLMPTLFNLLLWSKLSRVNTGTLIIPIFSALITTLVFIIQMDYRNTVDFGCIKFIPLSEVNISYASTMVFFSILVWELGIAVYTRPEPK